MVSSPGLTELPGPRHPADLVSMAHSPAYFAAAGAADRTFGWEHASAEKIADPVLPRLIDTIMAEPPPVEGAEAYRRGERVTIETRDGRSYTAAVPVPRGAACLGIEWADVDAKYRRLLPGAVRDETRIERSLDLIHRFEDLDHVSPLLEALAPPGAAEPRR